MVFVLKTFNSFKGKLKFKSNLFQLCFDPEGVIEFVARSRLGTDVVNKLSFRRL